MIFTSPSCLRVGASGLGIDPEVRRELHGEVRHEALACASRDSPPRVERRARPWRDKRREEPEGFRRGADAQLRHRVAERALDRAVVAGPAGADEGERRERAAVFAGEAPIPPVLVEDGLAGRRLPRQVLKQAISAVEQTFKKPILTLP